MRDATVLLVAERGRRRRDAALGADVAASALLHRVNWHHCFVDIFPLSDLR